MRISDWSSDVCSSDLFKIRTFHHANEAFKIAPLLAKEDICVATWANSWGAKMESLDGIEENAPMVDAAGGCAIIHSADGLLIQRLGREAGIGMTDGKDVVLGRTGAARVDLGGRRIITKKK